MYCVYKITDLRNDEIVYVGKTKKFNHRRSNLFTQSKQPVQKYMLEQGRENFEMSMIQADIESNEEALKIEDDYIVDLKPMMNKNRSGHIAKDDPKEYNRKYNRAYYHTSYKEHQREYHKEYYKSDNYREYQREYHKSEQWKQYQKEYYKSEKWKEYYRQYRLKKKQNRLLENTTL